MVDSDISPGLLAHRWRKHPKSGVAYREEKGRVIYLHREILGNPPVNWKVEFENGNSLDCREANLRVVEEKCQTL